MHRLRVIIDGPRDPQLNMAIDEAILVNAGPGMWTLRIYMWSPSGVSIGRAQDARKAINILEAQRRGYKLVRRPTGGRALLHSETGEVTYSIVVTREHPLYSLDVASSAAKIAEGVAGALRRIGLDARVGGYQGVEDELCYLREGASDVTVKGVKVSGSAQVRLGHALLQHGTLLLDFDPEEWASVIRTSIRPEQLAQRVAGLKQLGHQVELATLVEALAASFSSILGAEPDTGSLTGAELEDAIRLYRLKYATPEWNLEGRQ